MQLLPTMCVVRGKVMLSQVSVFLFGGGGASAYLGPDLQIMNCCLVMLMRILASSLCLQSKVTCFSSHDIFQVNVRTPAKSCISSTLMAYLRINVIFATSNCNCATKNCLSAEPLGGGGGHRGCTVPPTTHISWFSCSFRRKLAKK